MLSGTAAATDIANSGVPVKVGMALTAHKTVTMFMRYVHTEDDPISGRDGGGASPKRCRWRVRARDPGRWDDEPARGPIHH